MGRCRKLGLMLGLAQNLRPVLGLGRIRKRKAKLRTARTGLVRVQLGRAKTMPGLERAARNRIQRTEAETMLGLERAVRMMARVRERLAGLARIMVRARQTEPRMARMQGKFQ